MSLLYRINLVILLTISHILPLHVVELIEHIATISLPKSLANKAYIAKYDCSVDCKTRVYLYFLKKLPMP